MISRPAYPLSWTVLVNGQKLFTYVGISANAKIPQYRYDTYRVHQSWTSVIANDILDTIVHEGLDSVAIV